MKKFSPMTIACYIAIALFIALLIFLFIFPISYAKKSLNEVIALSEEGIYYAENGEMKKMCEKISIIDKKLEKAVKVLKLFYDHNDIAKIQTAIFTAMKYVDAKIDSGVTYIECLSQVIDYSKHVLECDNFGWQEFL